VETVTIDEAIARGRRIVNWPVRGLLATPAVLYIVGCHTLGALVGPQTFDLAIGLSLGVCFVAAWLWWSFQVPKWRLWAYERVEDIPELKRRAILAQLIWPDGSVFGRTEIKSASHAARERELEQRPRAYAAT